MQLSRNLTVNGPTVTVTSSTTSVSDSMIELDQQNTSSDTLDIEVSTIIITMYLSDGNIVNIQIF